MARFRVPAGVRLAGRGIGGRFIGGALDLVAYGQSAAGDGDESSLITLIEFTAAQADRAASRYEKAERRFQDDPKRGAAVAASAERDLAAWSDALDALLSFLSPDEGGGVEPPFEAVEWEIAFDYDAAAGSSSNFDLTLRMSRVDGAPMPESEARAVLADFRAHVLGSGMPHEPAGYRFHAINWRRPRDSRWRPYGRATGDLSDLAAFAAPLYVAADVDEFWVLRIGAVE